MKTPFFALVALLALIALALPASGQEKKKLTNDKVLQMIKAEIPESTVILAIQADPAALDTSADALIKMKEGGASKEVLDAMVAAKSGKPEPVVSSKPVASAETPNFNQVILVSGNTRTNLMQGGEMKTTVAPFVGVRMRQVFQGAESLTRIKGGGAVIELDLHGNRRPEESVFLVKPQLKKDERRVETSRTSGFMVYNTSAGKKELVAVKFEKIGESNLPGLASSKYRVTPETPLAPGEYVLIANDQFFDFGIDK